MAETDEQIRRKIEEEKKRANREEERLEGAKEAMNESGFIGKLIAGINPDRYTQRDKEGGLIDKSGFKKALKENFWQALKDIGKFNLKPKCVEEHKLIYDSTSETMEPVYFWIVDKMEDVFPRKVEKLVDNFASSPGSGHFSELMGKATKMQEEAMKIMQTTGVLIKSLVNIIYDLKEFEIRISHYKTANSKNAEEAEAGLLALKQIWMDNVDIKRGTGSINALTTGNLNFVTLRDAFMAVKTLEDVDKMDLNDRVKRILKPRIQEFLEWRKRSEAELKKRYEIERTYLKNQLAALKLYTRWAKPYLRTATQLEQKEFGRSPALVTAFNTIVFELTLFGRKSFNFPDAVANQRLPEAFRGMKLKRDYNSCVLVDFYFRGIPQRVGQHYVFGGRVEVSFKAYSLNEEELRMLNQKLDESDVSEALKLVSGMTDESLKELQEDVSYFLKEERLREKLTEEAEEKGEDVNPFSALLGMTEKKEKKEEGKKEIKEVKPDNYVEKMVRGAAESSAKESCFQVWDIYKKAHRMPSHPPPEFDEEKFRGG